MDETIRLLLIDDDAVDRMAVIRALRTADKRYAIAEAVSAAEGLQLAAVKISKKTNHMRSIAGVF